LNVFGVAAALPAVPGGAAPPKTFNPIVEAQNFSITQERQAVYDTPQYQAQSAADSAAPTAQAAAAQAADLGQFFADDPMLEPWQRLRRRQLSCSTGTSHATKQNARVASRFDAPYDPFWQLLDPSYGVGLGGHPCGAAGVSYIGQWDPRVKTIVAWDDLGVRARTTRPSRGPPLGLRRGRSARPAARPIRRPAAPSRSPNPPWARPLTTGCRRRPTPRYPTRTPSRRGR
jgi:hypothetical protein